MRKYKKGFTLVELLAVIAVLGTLAIIAFPIVTKQITNSKENSYKTQVNIIVNAAKRWAFDNDNLLPYTDGSSKTVSLTRIQQDGYLTSGDVVDPRTESNMAGCIKITYDDSYKQHNYEYINN